MGVGAVDSPQATLLPLSLIRSLDVVPGDDVEVVRFDVGVGLHGDHIGGERDAMVALRDGRVDAACVTDSNLLLFSREGTVTGNALTVLAHTETYDHCMMTVGPGAEEAAVETVRAAFLGMSYADSGVRPLLDAEGLTAWLPGRTDRYTLLERAVDEAGFYDAEGRIIARDYRP